MDEIPILHFTNQLLPSSEARAVTEDERDSIEAMVDSIVKLESIRDSEVEIVDPVLLGKNIRLVSSHLSMKYEFSVALKSREVNTLMSLYMGKTIALPMKTKILAVMHALISKKYIFLDFVLPWKALWTEGLDKILRSHKHGTISSDSVNSKFIRQLFDFLHKGRMYVSKSDDSITQILNESMDALKDIRFSSCMEGLILLLHCLPSDITVYDDYLETWTKIWASIEHNVYWDVAWLTLFARARKFSVKFDWFKLNGTLFSKAKELMQLVTIAGDEFSTFPRVTPNYYAAFIASADSLKVALKKISKLLYFLVATDPKDLTLGDPMSINPIQLPPGVACPLIPGYNTSGYVKPQAVEMCLFVQSIRTYFYPSNVGSWTTHLGLFFNSFIVQIGKHMGNNIAKTLFHKLEANDKATISIHFPTIKYLIGCLLSVIFEGLYGKSSVMMQYSSLALKQIVSYDPSFGDLLIPLFLTALDPSAVNQSHQAPAVLHALALVFKPLMYPKPVMLPYLPDILKLSLPGLDTSDMAKTSVTLGMFSMILCWIPIRNRYSAPSIQVTSSSTSSYWHSYADLLDESYKNVDSQVCVSQSAFQANLDALSSCWAEWVPLFWDRIVALLDSQETPHKHTRQSPLIGRISECVAYLFQSMNVNDATAEDISEFIDIRSSLEDRLLTYCKTTAHYNAAKTLAKIVEIAVATNPMKLLPIFVSELLDNDVRTLSCSFEKVAFRLRLVGGACRNATGNSIVSILETIKLVINDNKFCSHPEKSVRKATFKLVKDVLRGLTSFYIINTTPVLGGNGNGNGNVLADISHSEGEFLPGRGSIFCAPIPMDATVAHLHWHEASVDSLHAAISLLKSSVSDSMQSVKDLLMQLQGQAHDRSFAANLMDMEGQSDAASKSLTAVIDTGEEDPHLKDKILTAKKAEEIIIIKLKLIEKALRGSAEILGDDIDSSSCSCATADIPTHTQQLGQLGGESPFTLIHTGRELLVSQIPSDIDQKYLKKLRHEVSECLLFIYNALPQSQAASNTGVGVGAINNLPAQASHFQSALATLAESPGIYKQWMKIFKVIIRGRMSCLKNFEAARKWISMSLQISSPVLIKTIRGYIKSHANAFKTYMGMGVGGKLSVHTMTSPQYWLGHELTTNTLGNKGFVQHINRCNELSSMSIRVSLLPGSGSPINQGISFLTCLKKLAALCGHDYDSIRPKALKTFESVSNKFGWQMTDIVRRLISAVDGSRHDYMSGLEFSSVIEIRDDDGNIVELSAGVSTEMSSAFSNTNGNTIVTNIDAAAVIDTATDSIIASTSPTPSPPRYAELAGCFAIMRQSLVMKRIIGQWDLLEAFLVSICTSISVVAKVSDPEKRERLYHSAIETFLKYLDHWAHIPIPCGKSIDMILMVALHGLGSVSMSTATANVSQVGDSSSSILTSVTASSSLRHDCILAYIVLHFIGHKDVGDIPTSVWTWASHTVATAHSQPVQQIALAILMRLFYQAQRNETSHDARFALSAKLWKNFNLIDCNTSNTSNSITVEMFWHNLLYGIAQSYPKRGEDASSSAQWSRGIENILSSVSTLSLVLPRKQFAKLTDGNLFSYRFRKIIAMLFVSMLEFGLLTLSPATSAQNIFPAVALVKVILQSSRSLVSNGEEEDKTNNCVRAMLFSGLYRGCRNLAASESHLQIGLPSTSTSTWNHVEKELVEFYLACTKDVSKDFANDWAEAVIFALEEWPITGAALMLPTVILDDFKVALSVANVSVVASGGGPSGSNSNEEGFARVHKSVIFVRALLLADFSCLQTSQSQPSMIMKTVFDFLADRGASSIVSSFQNIRHELAYVIGLVTVQAPLSLGLDVKLIVDRLMEPVLASTSSPSMVTDSDSPDETTSLESQALKEQQLQTKYCIEVALGWLNYLVHHLLTALSVYSDSPVTTDMQSCLAPLLELVLIGSGHPDLEFAKKCHGHFLRIVHAFSLSIRQGPCDVLNSILSVLTKLGTHDSWHVRETVCLAVKIFIGINWNILTADERRQCKDIVMEALFDAKPEVQALAMRSMIVYLTTAKSVSEIKIIAMAYARNCDTLAVRESKKRKLQKSEGGNVSSAPLRTDRPYWSTINMCCCIVQCYPYDLPDFMPVLLTSLVKHIRSPELQLIITRVVQDFKRTHQDQWLYFSSLFSQDQLDDLQGTAAQHYFA